MAKNTHAFQIRMLIPLYKLATITVAMTMVCIQRKSFDRDRKEADIP